MISKPSKQIVEAGESNTAGATFHLKIYYYFVEFVGFIVPISIAMVAYFFPNYFQWISNYSVSTMIVVLLSFGLCDAVFLICHELTGKNFFFNLNRYLFVCFYIFIVVVTGGVNSSFIFVLIFPLVVSAVYLDKNTTRNIGIFQTILFAGVIFSHPWASINSALVTKHIFQMILMGTIVWMMYRVVVETLSQKYEKEDTARRLAELININNLKNDFLNVAEHRLRTPLSGARWALESVMVDKSISDSVKPLVAGSLERVEESISIVNEMLKTVEGAASGSVSLAIVDVELSTLIRSIVRELAFVISKNNVSVNLDIPDEFVIKADRKKIYAALSNVIDNACRYTKNGEVSISLKREGEQVVCTVIDSGIGIDVGDLPYVFDRLHRGKNAMSVEPDESGVGLYISKRIIEMHNGTIKVDSKLNEGTTVTVSLPVNE